MKKLKDYTTYFHSSSFIKNVTTVGGSIAIVQIINMLVMPFLTRLYGPAAFGIAAAFASALTIITPLATMGYANAIVLPKKDEDALRIVQLSTFCSFVVFCFSLLIISIFKDSLAKWVGISNAPNVLYLMPFALIISAFLSVASSIAIRKNLFKEKAKAYIGTSVISNLVKLIIGLATPSGLVLIILNVLTQLINLILQIFYVPQNKLFKPIHWFGVKGIKEAAISQKDFPIYRMPQSILNASVLGLPVILLTSLFGSTSAGQYSLAILILGAPAMLLGQAVGEVFYPKITHSIMVEPQNAYKLLVKVSLTLFLVGLFPFTIILFFGKWIVTLVFGDQWATAGYYSQLLSMWIFSTLVSGASTAAIPALKLQRFLLIREIFSVVLRVIALYVGFYVFHSDLIAVGIFSTISILLSLSIMVVVFRKMKILNFAI
nr:oligosaccharide flippase family protein [Moraxella osloensis]